MESLGAQVHIPDHSYLLSGSLLQLKTTRFRTKIALQQNIDEIVKEHFHLM